MTKSIAIYEAELATAIKECNRFSKKVDRLQDKIASIKDSEFKNETMADWLVAKMPSGYENSTGWHTLNSMSNSNDTIGMEHGVSFYGCAYEYINQYVMQVSISRIWSDEKLQQVKSLIENIAQYIKPGAYPNHPNGKVFNIFEKSLSEFASYSLVIEPNRWVILIHRHFRESVEFENADPMEVLKYIRSNLWYGIEEDEQEVEEACTEV